MTLHVWLGWVVAVCLAVPTSSAPSAQTPRDELTALRTVVAKNRSTATPDLPALHRYLELWARLAPSERDENLRFGVYLVYEILAADAHRRGDLEGERQVLRDGVAAFSRDPGATRERAITTQLLDRAEMIGAAAPPITGADWLNASPAGGRWPLAGEVTLLEFTAHWCGPCKDSYAGLTRLTERYGARGFRVVLATRLYGYFGTRRNLTADDERAALRSLMIDELHLPFPTVVSGATDPNADAYFVQPIPHFVLIDRAGRVRAVELGWDAADEARWATRIEALLPPM